MRIELVTFVVIVCLLLSGNSALAQQGSTSPAPGSIEAALAVEDPAARITALQKFLKTNNIAAQSQKAREAIVASWAQLAEVQLNQNNIEKAVADFSKAIAALPDPVTDQFFEETVIRIPQAVSIRGYRNEAIRLARQLEKRFAKEPLKLGSVGEFYMTVEASTEAIRALEAAVKLKDSEARLHRLLGAAYRIGLRLDDAIAEIQLAIKIDPEDKRAYYELANLYRAFGAYTDAIRLYKKQLEIDPQHTPSYKGMALAYLGQGNTEQYLAALNQARELRSAPEEITQDIYLQTQMAFCFLALGDVTQARKAAEAALSVEPRYSWARIAAAEIELTEGKYFEAERNLVAAQQYAGFPTLFFTLGKLYLTVEDFDGALEQFEKAFTYSSQKKFTAKLGGVLEVQADNVKELLSREHQAAIFLADSPTIDEQLRIAQSLVRFDVILGAVKAAESGRSGQSESAVGTDAGRKRLAELDQAAMDFIDAEKTRRSFRSLYIARRLAQAGALTGKVIELSDQALNVAQVVTEFDGSLPDYPNFDREGRLRIFRGRALDAKGLALFKAGQNQEAIAALSEAVRAYGPLPEGKRSLWHLATAKELGGDLREALELYLAGYDPPSSSSNSDINRTVIEGLYRKVNGSLKGLDERLARAASGTEAGAVVAALQAPDNTPSNALATKPIGAQQRDTKESLFKFSPQTSPTGKDRPASSSKLSRTKEPATSSPPPVPSSDPIFARKTEAEPKSTDSTRGPSEGPSRAPETPTVTKTPVVQLPAINSNFDPVAPRISLSRRKLLAQLSEPKIQLESEPPPPPSPAEQSEAQTRKRYVTTNGTTTNGTEPDNSSISQPKANTRKRRVTSTDGLPNQ